MAAFMLKINGQHHQIDVDPGTPLLWAIRDGAGLTGTKYGCGVAQCGACTVYVDGQTVRSCSLPVSAVGTSEVTTIEGLNGKICRCATYVRIRAAIHGAAKSLEG